VAYSSVRRQFRKNLYEQKCKKNRDKTTRRSVVVSAFLTGLVRWWLQFAFVVRRVVLGVAFASIRGVRPALSAFALACLSSPC